MCRPVVQLCFDQSKLLVVAGSVLMALAGLLLAYTTCTSTAIIRDIDASVADQRASHYYTQMATAGYLLLLALYACLTAYYNQKRSIELLATLSTLNFVFALCLIVYMHNNNNSEPLGPQFADRLREAREMYNFTDRGGFNSSLAAESSKTEAMPDTLARQVRQVAANNQSSELVMPTNMKNATSNPMLADLPAKLESAEATKIWDRLQSRGCCGFRNATEEWTKKLPKSCCCHPEVSSKEPNSELLCRAIDSTHSQPCIELIESSNMNILFVYVVIALVNLFVATVTSVTTYRTYHYNEASQSAY